MVAKNPGKRNRRNPGTSRTDSPRDDVSTEQQEVLDMETPDPEAPDTVAGLVTEGARLVKAYGTLHGRETSLARDITRIVVRLREKHENKDGRPDLRGTSQEYRDAVASIYRKAGIPSDAASNLQGLIRYHMSTVLREYMKERGYDEEAFEYYKLLKKSKKERHAMWQKKRAELAESAATVEVDRNDLPGSAARILSRAEGDVTSITDDAEMLSALVRLSPGDREHVSKQLDAVEQAIAVIRSYM